MRRMLAMLGSQKSSGAAARRWIRCSPRCGSTTRRSTRLIERAYRRRASGEPYITHPLAVATILAELGMTPTTLAAPCCTTRWRTPSTPSNDCGEDFGDEVARLVDGVTKLDKVKYGEASAAETVRKMVVAMARDIRVLVIKLADRLHNMRTIQWLPEKKQQKKARETLEIYAPLAHRLGMNTIKWELEDLAFATLYPKMYDEIVRLVGQRAPSATSTSGRCSRRSTRT
jgi:GTP pyrophosphokinase